MKRHVHTPALKFRARCPSKMRKRERESMQENKKACRAQLGTTCFLTTRCQFQLYRLQKNLNKFLPISQRTAISVQLVGYSIPCIWGIYLHQHILPQVCSQLASGAQHSLNSCLCQVSFSVEEKFQLNTQYPHT